jgi:hypothetical protein
MDSIARRKAVLGIVAASALVAAAAFFVTGQRGRGREALEARAAAAPPAAPTPAALREQQERREREARVLKHDAQDEELAQALARPGQWKMLPAFVANAYADPSGHTWFVDDSDGTDADFHFRRSVERIASGKPGMLRGGRVLLVDRAGHYWGCVRDVFLKHRLECYDSGAKQWLAPRLAAGLDRKDLDPRGSQALSVLGEWTEPASWQGSFEDSAGNLYFFGGAEHDSGFGVHRRAPDGTWTFQKLDTPYGTEEFLRRDPRFVEQPGGRITIAAGYGYGSVDSCRVLHYDGQQWSEISPIIEHGQFSDVRAVIPLRDGSIATLMNGERLWAYWPKGALPQRSLEQLADSLESADVAEREKASQALVAMGPTALDSIRRIRQQADSPEAQRRLDDVIHTLEGAAGDGGGDDGDDADAGTRRNVQLHGGRFLFGHTNFVSLRRDGAARFYVERCTDLRTNRTLSSAFVTVDPDGTWDAVEIPMRQWADVGSDRVPERLFEDSRGGVWLGGTLRTNARTELEPAAPDGLYFDERDVRFEDHTHRVFVRRDGRYIVFDPAAPETKPDLPGEHVLERSFVRVLTREREGWGVDYSKDPLRQKLFRLGADGSVTTIPPKWDMAGFLAIVPMKGGAVVRLGWREADEPPEFSYLFWDGKAWHGAETFSELVHANAKAMASMAGRTFLDYGRYSTRLHLAADGAGGLWYASSALEPIPGGGGRTTQVNRFEYFDGANWHDVWAESGLVGSDSTILRAVGGGRGVIVEGVRSGSLHLVTIKDGRAFAEGLALGARQRDGTGSHFVDGPDGTWWARTGGSVVNNPPRMVRYQDGQLQDEEKNGCPLLFDRAGRFWSCDDKTAVLRVKLNGAWPEVPVAGVSATSRMIEAPDGRLLLLHSEAVSEITLDAAQSPPAVREANRWSWNGPRNTMNVAFVDDAGRLWLAGNGLRFSRFQLPPRK